MDEREKFNETLLPEKEEFYSSLNMDDITDTNVCEYHDLYLKSYTLLLADVFKNFRKMCLEIYNLDPTKFLSAPGLASQVALKKTEVKLDLSTNIDMLSIVENGIRG